MKANTELLIDLSNFTLSHKDGVVSFTTLMEAHEYGYETTQFINQSCFTFSLFNEEAIRIADNLLKDLKTVRK